MYWGLYRDSGKENGNHDSIQLWAYGAGALTILTRAHAKQSVFEYSLTPNPI